MPQSAKIAVVTGAGTGVGKAIAKALGRVGFSVVLAGRRKNLLDGCAEEIRSDGVSALTVVTDVTKPGSVAELFLTTKSQFGRLDVLVNNAGVNFPPQPLEDVSWEQWRSVIDTNVTGTFLCTQEAFRLMKSQSPSGGRIINNGSISASVPRPQAAAYTASKHAVTGLTKSTALDGRAFNIACGQIDIGNAATDMAQQMSHGILQANGTVASEPTIDSAHVADAVVYMAQLPLSANVLNITVMATKMPFVGRG